MNPFVDRLIAAQEKALFTISDMSAWFGVGRATMDYWLRRIHEPRPTLQRQTENLLLLLEKTLTTHATRNLFPVPLSIRQYDRKKYIDKVRDDATSRFSKVDSAGRGKKVLRRNTTK